MTVPDPVTRGSPPVSLRMLVAYVSLAGFGLTACTLTPPRPASAPPSAPEVPSTTQQPPASPQRTEPEAKREPLPNTPPADPIGPRASSRDAAAGNREPESEPVADPGPPAADTRPLADEPQSPPAEPERDPESRMAEVSDRLDREPTDDAAEDPGEMAGARAESAPTATPSPPAAETRPSAEDAPPSAASSTQAAPASRASQPPPERNAPADAATSHARLTGEVRIVGRGDTLIPPKHVIVSLRPQEGQLPAEPSPDRSHAVDMQDKTYRPGALYVRQGEAVNFRNSDNFRHNVFSRSTGNAFDLGTYGPGGNPAQRFSTPGLVKVYCNIHAEMATFIRVGRSPWGQVTGGNGTFRFDNLPPGGYEIDFWNVRAQTERTIDLKPGETRSITVTLDASRYQAQPHLNKFGKPYDKDPVDFGGGFEYF